MPRFFLIHGAILLFATTATASDNQPTAAQLRFFESSIRPLLAEHCWKCHGPKKQRADLRLDSRAAILKGGASGAVVTFSAPEKSLLLKAVRHGDPDLKMPPDRKLSDRQIADLARWLQMGVPYPQDQAVAKQEDPRQHWAFQPPRDPAVPAVKDMNWARSPLDRFILTKLEAKGFRPAPPPDRRALIRRATFDLIGLPPTPEEVDAFVKDQSPDAFARVVERLLASPHYGERWGRHWLDVARYSDSNGLDENIAYGNAWRYRDYVVAAFNQDKPYNQFILEQIAGDLLVREASGRVESSALRTAPPPQPSPTRGEGEKRSSPPTLLSQWERGVEGTFDSLIATGFLSLGPKVLAEPDERKMEMDIIDEQVDTVGRAFLGLTLGCARCHDHKFDPITTRDYYGLAGIFKSTRTMEHFRKIARWHEHNIGSEKEQKAKAAHDQQVAERKAAIQQVVQKASAQVKASAKPGTTLPKALEPLFSAEIRAKLKQLRDGLAALEKAAPQLPTAMGVTDDKILDVPIHIRGNHLKLGAVAPRSVPEVLAGSVPPTFDAKHSGRLQLARWLVRPDHPLTARVLVNRVWRWHFGQGLVRTPDNFGLLGERPDNQPLLDWLAQRFIEKGWSIKNLHRLIMLSATYQMGTTGDERMLQQDPENRLHWRSNVRRLEAEALRDALLAVTGTLDRKRGGSLLHVKNREFLFDHTSKDTTKYDSRRRSLYLPVIRNNLYDVFQLFDYPDPAVSTGDRSATTVAPQALFWLNSDWVGQLCSEWSERLLREQKEENARMQEIYQRAYGRAATKAEIVRGLALVQAVERALQPREPEATRRSVQAWASLCQVIVAANEFVYVN